MTSKPTNKRLVVACDGTWTNSDNGFERDSWLPWKTGGRLATPSNVTRICRALLPRSNDGVSQIVYYQAGLGSQNNWYSYFIGGYLGEGISENIREAYAFLCNNYEDGDEIILIGFSRGAFTARSIGALIAEVGLLTAKGLGAFYPIFKDWENQTNSAYKPKYGTHDWPVTRPRFGDPSYLQDLVKLQFTRRDIPIRAIAVWDTVGTLGVPDISIADIKLYSEARREYSFVNTEVSPNVEHAYQALALDEARKTFVPTVWETPRPGAPSRLKLLKQCWFPGVHSSVGGGYADTSISDITLAWMVTQLQRHLSFSDDFILVQQSQNKQYYIDHQLPVQSWAMGQIRRSDAGLLNTLTGRQARSPGEYHAMDPSTGKQLPRRLVNTCEFVHPSVRYRVQQKGLGLANSASSPGEGVYAPAALRGWKYYAPGQSWDDKSIDVGVDTAKWDGYGRWLVTRSDGSSTFIVEEKIEEGSQEMELVEAWPGVSEKLMQEDELS